MGSEDQKIDVSLDGDIAMLGLNRPEKLNALSWEMFERLHEYVVEIDKNRDIKAVILYSESERCFGVGADINDWAALKPLEMWRQWVRHGHRVIRSLEELLQPVICVTNGFVYGGSLELALAADIRIGEEGSQYAFPEVSIGTIPGWLGTAKGLQLLGPSRLKKMVFTGRPISDQQALAYGLIDELVESGKGVIRARELATQISERSPVAVSLAKQVINSLASDQPASALESIASGLAAQSADGAEGKRSFQEKRKPSFTGE